MFLKSNIIQLLRWKVEKNMRRQQKVVGRSSKVISGQVRQVAMKNRQFTNKRKKRERPEELGQDARGDTFVCSP